jgi:hypothetical protein
MLIALVVVAALVVLVLAHLVALPLSKKRAVLFRGAEAAVLASLVIVGIGLAVGLTAPLVVWMPLTIALLVAQAVIGLVWRPWVVLGLSASQVETAVTKASTMVRLRTERAGRVWQLDGIGGLQLLGASLLVFRVKRTKKLVLFQNVLRKCLQNYHIGRDRG